ncbi:unnamed protein product [Acanthoscelides obtectus]|uniref:Uncharacterized protein n=1 Tax=Acanthoscelides obtectus TaxID=200917 RepID=A0A9P0JVP6_ACAOB|nr:unnamed protein product [Acanthoscelides obtectus]CAK1648979.1 hypothetical protein AOBTE_LOCUS15980 [Acanthoscelides obtectus]
MDRIGLQYAVRCYGIDSRNLQDSFFLDVVVILFYNDIRGVLSKLNRTTVHQTEPPTCR